MDVQTLVPRPQTRENKGTVLLFRPLSNEQGDGSKRTVPLFSIVHDHFIDVPDTVLQSIYPVVGTENPGAAFFQQD